MINVFPESELDKAVSREDLEGVTPPGEFGPPPVRRAQTLVPSSSSPRRSLSTRGGELGRAFLLPESSLKTGMVGRRGELAEAMGWRFGDVVRQRYSPETDLGIWSDLMYEYSSM